MTIKDTPSPNFNSRPDGTKVDLIVLHGTEGSDAGDLSWLRDPKSRVSYHYLIVRDGTIYRLVDEEQRAWHAGKSEWQDREDVNDYSIGIGISCFHTKSPTDAQYKASAELVNDIRLRREIPLSRVVGHCHVSPGRKTDPWLQFHWSLLFEYMSL